MGKRYVGSARPHRVFRLIEYVAGNAGGDSVGRFLGEMTGATDAADVHGHHPVAEDARVLVADVVGVLQQNHSHVFAFGGWIVDAVTALVRGAQRFLRMAEYAVVDVDVVRRIFLHVGGVQKFVARAFASTAVEGGDHQSIRHVMKETFLD